MPRKADEKLSPVQQRALGMLLERTGAGEWLMSGQYAVRTNTLFALERMGLCVVRLNVPVRMSHGWYEAQITEAGRQLLAE